MMLLNCRSIDFGCADHFDLDVFFRQHSEHFRCYSRVGDHARTDDRHFGKPVFRFNVLEEYKDALDYEQIETENRLAKVSIVGSGMISNPGVAAEMFAVLAEKNIQAKMMDKTTQI